MSAAPRLRSEERGRMGKITQWMLIVENYMASAGVKEAEVECDNTLIKGKCIKSNDEI